MSGCLNVCMCLMCVNGALGGQNRGHHCELNPGPVEEKLVLLSTSPASPVRLLYFAGKDSPT